LIARLTCIFILTVGLAAQNPLPAKSAANFRITGKVVSSVTGQPLADVKVSIYSGDNNEFSQHAATGADGRFAFAGLPAAKYSLFGSAYGYRTQGFHQHGDFFIGIAVGPDLGSENLTFRLVPDARVEGTVTDEDNEAVRNASVTLYQRSSDTGRQLTRPIASAAADDRGHYSFGHLAPGTYFVAVSARPWYAQYGNPGERPTDSDDAARVAEEHQQLDVAYPMTFYPSADDSSGATAIILHPGDRVTADVAIRAMPAVHLRVKTGDEDNKTAGDNTPRGFPRVSQRIFEGALVPVMSAQGQTTTVGAYEYTGIAPGHYVVEMPEPGGKRAGWFKEMDLSGTVEIDARENPPLVSIAGALMLEGGARPSGKIYVVLANRASAETFVAEVNAKGNFDFNDMEVRPGTYDIVLNNAPGFQIKSMLAKGARAVGQTLEISANSVQLVVTATHAVARIDGTVIRDDKPFAGAMVVLVPRDPTSNLTLFRRDQSDSDGTFTLREVLPGPYTVIALENGWELDWANPATLQPYLKNGTPIEVTGEGKLNVKVQLQ
jgi:5-hydroxyisourate hydrolase-like protein (transthyretin family)